MLSFIFDQSTKSYSWKRIAFLETLRRVGFHFRTSRKVYYSINLKWRISPASWIQHWNLQYLFWHTKENLQTTVLWACSVENGTCAIIKCTIKLHAYVEMSVWIIFFRLYLILFLKEIIFKPSFKCTSFIGICKLC